MMQKLWMTNSETYASTTAPASEAAESRKSSPAGQVGCGFLERSPITESAVNAR